MDNYTEGIAFILEGATEKVFYKAYLEYLSALDEKTSLIRNKLTDDGEIIFCWQSGEKKILVKFYVVGTITQIAHSSVLAYWYLVKYFWLLLPFYDTIKETAVISYGKTKKVQNQTYG